MINCDCSRVTVINTDLLQLRLLGMIASQNVEGIFSHTSGSIAELGS